MIASIRDNLRPSLIYFYFRIDHKNFVVDDVPTPTQLLPKRLLEILKSQLQLNFDFFFVLTTTCALLTTFIFLN